MAPGQTIYKGIQITDLPNKTKCTSDVFDPVDTKVSILQVYLAHVIFLFQHVIQQMKAFHFEVKIRNECIQIF